MPHFDPQNPETLSGRLAGVLSRHASHAFGLMGNGNAHFIEGLLANEVAFTNVRHEAGAVVAADAYTRVSGKIAIATTTYGPGFTNMLTALAEAAQARTPMLVVVGDAPSSGPRPWDVDQDMASAALGVRLYSVAPTGIAETVARAVATAARARRPVVLAIPADLAAAVIPAPAPAPTEVDLNDPAVLASLSAAPAAVLAPAPLRRTVPPTTSSPTALAAALDALAGAARPVIIAGRGAWLSGAHTELGRIAEVLGALTASTALARGIFTEARFDLGIIGGFGQEAAMHAIATADVALVVASTSTPCDLASCLARAPRSCESTPTTSHHQKAHTPSRTSCCRVTLRPSSASSPRHWSVRGLRPVAGARAWPQRSNPAVSFVFATRV
jgi:acetolactate synthase-1/2/3 large subunit